MRIGPSGLIEALGVLATPWPEPRWPFSPVSTETPRGVPALLSVVWAVRNAVLQEGEELFERAELQFAASVDFFDMALELAFSRFRLWA